MVERAGQIDTRALCPTTQEVCFARLALLEGAAEDQHIRRDGSEQAFPEVDDDGWNGEEMYPRSPFMAMSIDTDRMKLREYDFHAKRLGCTGPVDEDCPTRLFMVDSAARTGLLKFLRTFLNGV